LKLSFGICLYLKIKDTFVFVATIIRKILILLRLFVMQDVVVIQMKFVAEVVQLALTPSSIIFDCFNTQNGTFLKLNDQS
jgi:hypothetical protein